MSGTSLGGEDAAPGTDRAAGPNGTPDRSVLMPADLGFDAAAEGLSAFSTTAASPEDHGDFNLSLTTARRHEQHSGNDEEPGHDEERAARNLAVLRRLCGRPVARLHQVHSACVVDLDNLPAVTDAALAPLARTDADALLTGRRGVALAILTGDCVPLLFADRVRGVFAAAHSGRLGTEKDIAGAVIAAMAAKGSKASDIHVWIGPHICGDCYETGEKIARAFGRRFPGCATVTRFGGPGVDLGRAIRLELAQAGVVPGHIVDVVTAGRQPRMCCTLEDTRFYSYRGFTLSGDTRRDGRFYTVLAV